MTARPLFIPLKREGFDAFAHGRKTHEWRRYGPRWNEAVCWVGRPVVLSLGYSGARIEGVITSFRRRRYGRRAARIYAPDTVCAVFGIAVSSPR